MDIIIKISDGFEGKYLLSFKKVIKSIKKDPKLKNIHIKLERYNFSKNDLSQIKNSGSEFVYSRFNENISEKQKVLIFIPDSSINLKNNYLWYGTETEKLIIMVVSSFLFKRLIEGKIEFGAYVLILFSQFLTRLAVKLDEPHRKSKNCLNDHCNYQIELLNIFENDKDVLCQECLNNLISKNKKYYTLAKNIINNIKQFYYIKKVETKKEIPKQLKIKSEIQVEKGHWYEFEIYMAKKCANIYNLYKKLDKLLLNTKAEIRGYSLYEVGGGWRGDIDLKNASEDEWKKLNYLYNKYGKNDFKDIIKPLINKKDQKCAVFDETSIVLRIIAKTKDEIENLDPKRYKILGEILEICDNVTKKEKSIYFTMKKLERKGSIVEIQD